MPKKTTYIIYCAQDQKRTEWNHLPDRNGEILFQCVECGRFLKFPIGTSRGRLAKLFIEQEKQNIGATPVETVPTAPIVPVQMQPPAINTSFWEELKKAFKPRGTDRENYY